MPTQSSSRTMQSIAPKGRKFRFRWWMALILVGIVALIGIAILRFSHASVIPQDELAKIQTGITVSNPGITGVTVSYPPYNYTRQFSLPEALRAQQDPAEYDKLIALVIADLEKIYIQNNPNAPATASDATTSTDNPTSNTPTNQPAPTVDNTTPTTESSPQSSSTSSTASASDTQSSSTPKDLGKISGLETIHFTSTSPDAVKSVSLIVNNKLIRVVNKPPYTFDFDTRQFDNGTHPINIVVTSNDNSTLQLYYTAKIQNSDLARLFYSFGAPIRFLLRS